MASSTTHDNDISAKPSRTNSPTTATSSPDLNEDNEPISASQSEKHPEFTDQTNFLPARKVVGVFCGLATALGCAFLDQTIVATALPRISSDLHSGRESSWVATAYLLTSLAFTPLYGRWSDVFGRKAVLLASLGIFWIFSMACALSRTMIQLIVFRAFKGIGGGAIITMVLIIISDVVTLKERGKYQAINEIVIASCNALGPILGGVFSQRWCFWINLPLGGLAIVCSVWLIPFKPMPGGIREKLLKIDYVGSGLTIVSSALILLGLNWGGITFPWTSVQVLVPLVLGGVTLVAFLIWEGIGAKLPIVPLHIFRNRTVAGVYIGILMNGMTFFAMLYYVPQFLQLVRDTTPVHSSLLILPFLVVIRQIIFRTGYYKPSIVSGYAVWTVAQGLLTTVNETSSNGKIIGILLMASIGAGGTFQTSLIAAQAAVPRHEMAVVTGVRNFLRLFGSTLVLAIAAAIVNNTLRTSLTAMGSFSEDLIQAILDDPTSINHGLPLTADQKAAVISTYARGFQRIFYMTVALVFVGFAASAWLIGQHTLERDDDKEIKADVKERLRVKKAAKKASKVQGDVEA